MSRTLFSKNAAASGSMSLDRILKTVCLRVCILGPPSTLSLVDLPYLYRINQLNPSSYVVSACVSHLGINLVQDPPNGSCDLEAQVNGQGEVDGETNQFLHAEQDEHVDGVPEGSGEGNGEEDVPERRHRERLVSMANSRGLEDVVWYWRRLVYVYRCGRSVVSGEWVRIGHCPIQA